MYIYFIYAAFLYIVLSSAAIGFLIWKLRQTQKTNLDLALKHQTNPSYDCQLMLADMLNGGGMFKIERVESDNLFLYRR